MRKKKKKLHHRGRTPRAGVGRYPNGEIVRKERGETSEQIMAVALNQPHRRGRERPDDKRHGYALGALRMAGERGLISAQQFEAGRRFAELHDDYLHIMGLPHPYPKSPAFEMISQGGLPPARDAIDPSGADETARRAAIVRTYNQVVSAILSDSHRAREAWSALYRVCVESRMPADAFTLSDLRYALDRVATAEGLTAIPSGGTPDEEA